MSGNMVYYLKMAAVASVDLLLGFGVAFASNSWFSQFTSIDPTLTGWDRVWQEGLYACAQAASTVLVADEMRNLIYPPDFQDPTGGIIFMNALLQQPLLWSRSLSVAQFLDSKWRSWWGPKIRMDDKGERTPDSRDERTADSDKTELTRLGQVAYLESQMTPGVSLSSFKARGGSSNSNLVLS